MEDADNDYEREEPEEEASATVAGTPAPGRICTFFTGNGCKRGHKCPFEHPEPPAALHHGSSRSLRWDDALEEEIQHREEQEDASPNHSEAPAPGAGITESLDAESPTSGDEKSRNGDQLKAPLTPTPPVRPAATQMAPKTDRDATYARVRAAPSFFDVPTLRSLLSEAGINTQGNKAALERNFRPLIADAVAIKNSKGVISSWDIRAVT